MWYIYGNEAGGFGDVAQGVLFVKNPHDAVKVSSEK